MRLLERTMQCMSKNYFEENYNYFKQPKNGQNIPSGKQVLGYKIDCCQDKVQNIPKPEATIQERIYINCRTGTSSVNNSFS